MNNITIQKLNKCRKRLEYINLKDESCKTELEKVKAILDDLLEFKIVPVPEECKDVEAKDLWKCTLD